MDIGHRELRLLNKKVHLLECQLELHLAHILLRGTSGSIGEILQSDSIVAANVADLASLLGPWWLL